MKKNCSLLFTIVMAAFFVSCEPDDVCASSTPTTPKLILRFYDAENPNEPKTVENLAIQGIENELIYSISTVDSLAVPLKSQSTSTSFALTKNYSNSTDQEQSEDQITNQINFIYTVEEIYVSRACGFKAQYELTEASIEPDSETWIQNLEIVSPLIENETNAHVKIYH